MTIENFRFPINGDVKQQIIIGSLRHREIERSMVEGDDGTRYLHTVCAIDPSESVREKFVGKGICSR